MTKLLTKLSAITEDLGSLEKTGTNSHFKYNYVKGEDAMKAFRTLEVKHKIKVIPVVQSNTLTVTPHGDGVLTTFIVDYNIMDLESSDALRVSLPAQGYDSNDKGVYKSLTGAFKYFLLQTFSYSSDDPEKDDIATKVGTFRKGVAAVNKDEMKASLPDIMEGNDKDILNTVGANSTTNGLNISKSRFNAPSPVTATPPNGITTTDTTVDTTNTSKVRFAQSGFTSFKGNS